MKNYIPVEGKRNLFRDSSSNSIVNTDSTAYDSYIQLRNQKLKEKDEMNSLKNEVDSIKDELGEIKSLLLSLLNK